MDYLGWELERQRAALAALLLGGGGPENGETARDGAPRGLEEALEGPAAARRGAGTPGRYAQGSGEAPGAWEAVRAARQDRAAEAGTGETPVSAWEAVLGEAAGVPAGFGGGTRVRLGEGTGVQTEFLRSSGGYGARRGARRRETGQAAETRGLPAGNGESGAGDGAVPSGAESGGDAAAGSRAAGRSKRALGAPRGGGYASDAPGLNRGPAALQGTGRTAGNDPWGSWGGAALRAEDSAKALSKAVQRDARRYDGGFTIY